MQYILTKEEMTALQDKDAVANQLLTKLPNLDTLATIVQHVALTMVETAPARGRVTGRPHGCVHVKPENPAHRCHYCDACPVAKVCLLPKEWSK